MFPSNLLPPQSIRRRNFTLAYRAINPFTSFNRAMDDNGPLLLPPDTPILGSFTWHELYHLYQQSFPNGGATLRGVVQQPVKQLEQSDVMVIKVLFARARSSYKEGDAEKMHDDDDGEGDKGCDARHVGGDDELSEEQFLIKYVNVPAQQQRITKTEEKWAISIQSFQNEASFYHHCSTTAESERLAAAAVHLPGCQYKGVTYDDVGKLQTSTHLLDYFSRPQYVQHHQLTFAQAEVALSALARFHGCYWKGGENQKTPGIFKDLFNHGGWWRPELRPSVKYDTIAESFASLCRNFPREFKLLDTPENHALMRGFQARVPEELSEKVRAKGPRTLIHGDCKTSNLFFSLENASENEKGSSSSGRGGEGAGEQQQLRCSLIDFQWTGAASSGMADVAYLLWSGVDVEGVRREAELLDAYYHALQAALPAAADDTAQIYTREEMESDIALEFLAYFATALPQLLNGMDFDHCEKWRGSYGWLTCETIPEVTEAFVGKALKLLREIKW